MISRDEVSSLKKGLQILDLLKANVVLAWYLTREAIDVIIPGAKRADQVLNNLKMVDVQLSNEEIQEINMIFQA